MATKTKKAGKIAQIIGPVIDVAFESDAELPDIHEALSIRKDNGEELILECQQEIGESTVRTIAMDSTDGLRRGMEVIPMGRPISMPVSHDVRGRLFNVIGKTIDGLPELRPINYTLYIVSRPNSSN